MFGSDNASPEFSLVQMLKLTSAIMVFSAVIRVFQNPITNVGEYINTIDFMLGLFGAFSYLAVYLINQKNSLAYMPIAIATLYPLSVSLTTGQPLNIIVILFGAYILFRLWRLHQTGYFAS